MRIDLQWISYKRTERHRMENRRNNAVRPQVQKMYNMKIWFKTIRKKSPRRNETAITGVAKRPDVGHGENDKADHDSKRVADINWCQLVKICDN